MNLNEKCLLDYLQNPDELANLTAILEENINFIKNSIVNNVAPST
ncbi:MAG: hypothetical protein PHV37_00690 [Candidatus Gastranaerophilales bacterium]|nr:hypothetical protein [Candidatus Gastranaerophilales bacterium]